MGSDSPIKQAEDTFTKWKRRIYRVRNCGIIWLLVSILLFVIGIILLVFYASFINDKTNKAKHAGGIAGVVTLLLGILGLVIGVLMIVLFLHLFKKMERRMNGTMGPNTKYNAESLPPGSYPKQPPDVVDPSAYPGAEPSAPDPSHTNKAATVDEIHIEENVKF
ncbi:uncharacterized protein LOC141910070 [Tubulanus polymorphus]|uniref:uncharacterized protein LOC141910070 n=1 Tax=Tubulanus polymorphus TaxID=672921 RepID=UPI003DA60A79